MQLGLSFSDTLTLSNSDPISIYDCIVDRKSRYTVTAIATSSIDAVNTSIRQLIQDPYFRKATHNSYAYRLITPEGAIIESKNDDGEVGAGMCILREMQRANAVNMIIIVTRYFGGIHLQADRFKHVINTTKMLLERVGNSES